MPVLLPVASGKGGVGKSVIATNLAYQLARQGKTVILADMDWGGSNAHTMLGLKNSFPGIGEFVYNKNLRLDSLVVPLDEPHLFFLPGDGLIPGTANMGYFRKVKLIKELRALTADYVVLDLGAGTHYNTIDIYLACGLGFIITSPEPTALLNAYNFIKTALYRLLYASLPARHQARTLVQAFFSSRRESTADSSHNNIWVLFDQIAGIDPDAAGRLRGLHAGFCPRIMVNMGKEVQELALGGRLRQVCSRHLEVNIEYIAFIPWDDEVRSSIMRRQLLCKTNPGASFSKALGNIARKIATSNFEALHAPIEDFADLKALAEEAEPE